MKIFFVILFFIAGAPPAISDPVSGPPASDSNMGKNNGSKSTDDQIKEAKVKAKDDVIATFSKAKDAVKDDDKGKKRLEVFKAAILNMIREAGKRGGDAGGKAPPPTGSETPAPPA